MRDTWNDLGRKCTEKQEIRLGITLGIQRGNGRCHLREDKSGSVHLDAAVVRKRAGGILEMWLRHRPGMLKDS